MSGPVPQMSKLAASIEGDLEDVAYGTGSTSSLTVYERNGLVFARVTDDALEVLLPEDIAEAALRTPDTSELPSRPGWVRFAPTSAERHVTDRAEAWFRTAWRHAARPAG